MLGCSMVRNYAHTPHTHTPFIFVILSINVDELHWPAMAWTIK